MKLKKTWFSYLIWALFSIVTFASVGYSAYRRAQINQQNVLFTVAIVFTAAAAGVIGLYFLRKRIGYIDFSKFPAIRIASIYEVFGVIFMVICSFAFRFIYIAYSGGNLTGDDFLYQSALIDSGVSQADIIHNASHSFAKLLRFSFSLFGNKPQSGMYLQMLLQIITAVLVFLAVRKLYGKLTAWIVYICLCVLPDNMKSISTLGPDILITFYIAIVVLILTYIVMLNQEQLMQENSFFLIYIGLGLFCAYILFLDFSGILLVLATVSLFFATQPDDARFPVQKAPYQSLCYIVSTIGFLFLLFLLKSTIAKIELEEVISRYIQPFDFSGGLRLNILIPADNSVFYIVVMIIASFWFVTFLHNKEDFGNPYACFLTGSVLLCFFNLCSEPYRELSKAGWLVMACAGVKSLLLCANEEHAKAKQTVKKKHHHRKEKGLNIEVTGVSDMSSDPEEFIKILPDQKKDALGKSNTAVPAFKNEHSSSKQTFENGVYVEAPVFEIKKEIEVGNTNKKEGVPEKEPVSALKEMVSSVKEETPVIIKKSESAKPLIVNTSSEAEKNKVSSGSASKLPPLLGRVPSFAKNSNVVNDAANESQAPYIESPFANIQPEFGVNVKPVHYEEPKKAEFVQRESALPPLEPTKQPEIVLAVPEPSIRQGILTTPGTSDDSVSVKMNEFELKQTGLNNATPIVMTEAENTIPVVEKEPDFLFAGTVQDSMGFLGKATPDTILSKQNNDFTANKLSNEEITVPNRETDGIPTTQPVKRPSRFIHNPLPVPRKHVAKELTYDFEPKADQMDYDIKNFKGKDDYDI